MAQEERSMLVLFTSHELLSTVYHQVQLRLLEKGQEVLAQGISGSREKILKRFSNGKPNVLLGADSFWGRCGLTRNSFTVIDSHAFTF